MHSMPHRPSRLSLVKVMSLQFVRGVLVDFRMVIVFLVKKPCVILEAHKLSWYSD